MLAANPTLLISSFGHARALTNLYDTEEQPETASMKSIHELKHSAYRHQEPCKFLVLCDTTGNTYGKWCP